MIVIYKHKKNGTPQALELRAAPYLTLKCVNFVNFVNFL